MLQDVTRFILMYVIFLFAFSTLMVGAGGPRGAIDKCYTADLAFAAGSDRRSSRATKGESSFSDLGDWVVGPNGSSGLGGGAASGKQVPADQEDYEYVTCWQSWWFLRSFTLPTSPHLTRARALSLSLKSRYAHLQLLVLTAPPPAHFIHISIYARTL